MMKSGPHLHDDKAWSATAKEYQKIASRATSKSPMFLPIQAMLKTLNEVKPLSSATAIMDAGCGTGVSITNLLNDYGSLLPSSSRILASDFSEGMINVLRETANTKVSEGSSLWARLETQILDLQDLSPLPEAGLSHVFSSFVFGMLPDNAKAFREVNRVLAPGGVLVTATWAQITWMEWLYSTISKRWPDRPSTISWPEEFKTADGTRTLFEDAGYEQVQTEEVEAVLGDDDIDSFVSTFTNSQNPAMHSLFKGMSDDELKEATQLLADDLREKFPDGNVRLKGRAIVSVGFKKS